MGDFDDDGFDDLAVGVPLEDHTRVNEGAVMLVYGTRSGLNLSGGLVVRRTGAVPEAGDQFGDALATGDFDGDGFGDIAVGIPFEDSSGHINNGSVEVLFGSEVRSQVLRRDWFDENVVSVPEASDQFGFRLAAADFNGDGAAELAVGAPREDVGSLRDSGAVFVVAVEPALFSTLTARSAIVIDRVTGTVIGSKQPDVRRPMASTTKIMTALLVIERIAAGTMSANTIVTISDDAGRMGDAGEGSLARGSIMGDLGSDDSGQNESVGLSAGDTISILDLLYGLLLDSANDAAIALAEAASGSEEAFVGLMNARAVQLGLRNTRFANVHGRDPQTVDPGACREVDFDDPRCAHYSSARDLAELTQVALDLPLFATIVGTTTFSPTTWSARASGDVDSLLDNGNRLIRAGSFNFSEAYGVKTGTTRFAGRCLVSAARRTTLSFGNRPDVISVVLGTDDNTNRYTESALVLEFGLDNYRLPGPGPVLGAAAGG